MYIYKYIYKCKKSIKKKNLYKYLYKIKIYTYSN